MKESRKIVVGGVCETREDAERWAASTRANWEDFQLLPTGKWLEVPHAVEPAADGEAWSYTGVYEIDGGIAQSNMPRAMSTDALRQKQEWMYPPERIAAMRARSLEFES